MPSHTISDGRTISNGRTISDGRTWFRILTKKVLKPEEGKTDEGKDYFWVLCIGAPQEVSTELNTLLTEPQPPTFELQDPLAMLRPLFDEVIKLCDGSTWRVTKLVRAIELNRKRRPDFEGLRNLARHTGHIVEVEQVAIETIEQLLSRQESNFKYLDSLTETYQMQAREYLLFQLQMMKSLRWRAQSTQARLEEEITLAYNMLASSDNAVMKSITLLTMTFLPATFISALFSTTFFSFEEDEWQLSHKFWIY
ncbi:hypothetical protein CC86DRAFT_400620 [Ophiobolus disseminans]|uniref:Uncharacterized protein n=1 Tax=Ophiobolus disseminans TaxID=1469910 RepID=A0A6A7AEU8_9PLEO|nr:hypothetical protein CC86DRAFT_400620 [Ophiobolus disseminans]